MTARALVLFAHPDEDGSHAGAALIARAEDDPDIEVRRLYDLYPDFNVDVEVEQAAWEAADVIVLQHPFYWYSSPALLKEYLDVVLEHNWAYGTNGRALAGKSLLTVTTAASREENYRPDGYNKFPVETLLLPFEATANLCSMTYEKPVVVYDADRIGAEDLQACAETYFQTLKSLLARHAAGKGAAQ
ncbi:MAG: NAD(P)H-dependent oxidoreductase [Pseudomonadota bacterium]|nr:NAD(P)H-dependent oxidoreductase [Pseudomonadota bacterium]